MMKYVFDTAANRPKIIKNGVVIDEIKQTQYCYDSQLDSGFISIKKSSYELITNYLKLLVNGTTEEFIQNYKHSSLERVNKELRKYGL